MEKKAFIKVESDEVGARIHSNGSNYQMLLMMSLLIQAFKDGQLTNEDDQKNETFKKIVDFIRRLTKWIRLRLILLN